MIDRHPEYPGAKHTDLNERARDNQFHRFVVVLPVSLKASPVFAAVLPHIGGAL
jgi:hypothetical protein